MNVLDAVRSAAALCTATLRDAGPDHATLAALLADLDPADLPVVLAWSVIFGRLGPDGVQALALTVAQTLAHQEET